MAYAEFLTLVIEDGIEAARLDYTRPDEKQKLDGSLAGFAACRGADPERLALLLRESAAVRELKKREQAPDYWYWRCYEAEIEWVANVVSAAQMSNRQPVIVNPTVRGLMKAADILGVQDPPEAP